MKKLIHHSCARVWSRGCETNNCVVKKRDVQRAKAGANKIFKKLIFDSIEDREDTKDRDK